MAAGGGEASHLIPHRVGTDHPTAFTKGQEEADDTVTDGGGAVKKKAWPLPYYAVCICMAHPPGRPPSRLTLLWGWWCDVIRFVRLDFLSDTRSFVGRIWLCFGPSGALAAASEVFGGPSFRRKGWQGRTPRTVRFAIRSVLSDRGAVQWWCHLRVDSTQTRVALPVIFRESGAVLPPTSCGGTPWISPILPNRAPQEVACPSILLLQGAPRRR